MTIIWFHWRFLSQAFNLAGKNLARGNRKKWPGFFLLLTDQVTWQLNRASGLLGLASFHLLAHVLLMKTKFNMINYLSQAVQLVTNSSSLTSLHDYVKGLTFVCFSLHSCSLPLCSSPHLQPGWSRLSEQRLRQHAPSRLRSGTLLCATYPFLQSLLHPTAPFARFVSSGVLHQPEGLHQDHQHFPGAGAPPAGAWHFFLSLWPAKLGQRVWRQWRFSIRGRSARAAEQQSAGGVWRQDARKMCRKPLPPARHPTELSSF